jgi:hypothetical protein
MPMIDGNDQDTIHGIAEHLARESGRTPAECWPDALSVLDAVYERRVLALDEDGKVVDLGDIDQVYPQTGE